MNQEKIEKLEEEVKNIFCNAKTKSKYFPKDSGEAFWNIHVKNVIRFSREMARKYGANEDVLWVAAILHDIGQVENLEKHDELSVKRADEIMREKGFNKDYVELVKKTILTHRNKKYKPETLEQRILATADVLSHFKTAHYLWIGFSSEKEFKDLMADFSKKIERYYNEKIFFEDEKKMVEPYYKLLKEWFNYRTE